MLPGRVCVRNRTVLLSEPGMVYCTSFRGTREKPLLDNKRRKNTDEYVGSQIVTVKEEESG